MHLQEIKIESEIMGYKVGNKIKESTGMVDILKKRLTYNARYLSDFERNREWFYGL